MDSRRGTAARERFQHAGAGQLLIAGAGERHGQVVEVDHRGAGIPVLVGVELLEQQGGLREDAVEMLFRHGPCSDAEESGYRQGALECCPRRDHQQIYPRRLRILGVDGIGEADQVSFDLMLNAAAQRLAQLGGGSRDQRIVGAERLLDRGRTRPLAAARAALELGNRAAQRELLRQQARGAFEAAIVTGGEAHHRFAECPPRGERRTPRYSSQETCRALPVPAVHGIEAAIVPAPRRAAARARPRGAPAAPSNGQSPAGPPLPVRPRPAAAGRRDTRHTPTRLRRRPRQRR